MKEMESLLNHVKKTNSEMTMSKLKEELEKCKYSSVALLMVWSNERK